MGRAHEVRAASMAKTAAMKSKKYARWGKEIFQAAKGGVPDPEMNQSLKKVIEKAKKDQVPNDVIKRAIDKVSSGADESYENARYELFGPGGSTLIVDCLTDNVNRTVSDIRTVVNKCHVKLGAMNSVSYMYDNLCIVGFKGLTEEEAMDALINNGVDIVDMEDDNGTIMIYGNPTDLNSIKEAILSFKEVQFDIDEIAMLPKDKIKLSGDDLEVFNKLITMLDEVDDVNHVYHNVDLD